MRINEIDSLALHLVVIEQIAGNQKQIGIRIQHGIHDLAECFAYLHAVRLVIEVDIGGVDDFEWADHIEYRYYVSLMLAISTRLRSPLCRYSRLPLRG